MVNVESHHFELRGTATNVSILSWIGGCSLGEGGGSHDMHGRSRMAMDSWSGGGLWASLRRSYWHTRPSDPTRMRKERPAGASLRKTPPPPNAPFLVQGKRLKLSSFPNPSFRHVKPEAESLLRLRCPTSQKTPYPQPTP